MGGYVGNERIGSERWWEKMGGEDGPPGGRAVASTDNTLRAASTGCEAQMELNGMAIGSRAITSACEILREKKIAMGIF